MSLELVAKGNVSSREKESTEIVVKHTIKNEVNPSQTNRQIDRSTSKTH